MRTSQGTKFNKFSKKARVFVMDDASSCDKLLQCHRYKYVFKMNYIDMLCDCFLVRLCKMDGQMLETVKELLEDKTVLKFGVGIQDDPKRLWKMFGIDAQGCVDLRHVIQRSQ